MNLSANAQATLLLTSDFSARRRVSINLLVIVNGEVCIMAEAPTYQSRRASGAATARETYRLERSAYFRSVFFGLLARGHSLALAVDKWQRAGLWILTRGDADYPVRLKTDCERMHLPFYLAAGIKHYCKRKVWRLLAREMLRLMICAIPNNWPRNWPNRDLRYLWWCARY